MSRLIDNFGRDLGEVVEVSMKDSADPEFHEYVVYTRPGTPSEFKPVFTNVNEDGETYGEHDNLDAAMSKLAEFPNDSIVVRLVRA